MMQGTNIALTEYREQDGLDFTMWQWDPALMSGLAEDIYHPFQVKDWEALFADTQSNENFAFVIRRQADDQAVGFITLSDVKVKNRNGELGLAIYDPESRGKGYAKEALQLMLAFCFDHIGLHKVRLSVHGFNQSAIALYEKVGFILEGTNRESIFHEGQWYPQYDYGLLQKEWRTLKEAQQL